MDDSKHMRRKGFQNSERGAYQIFNDQWAERTLVFENEPLEKVLERLAKESGVNTVLLESGGELMGAFLDAGLIDEMVIYYAPMVTGGPNPGVGGEGVSRLEDAMGLINAKVRQVGNDLCVRGVVGLVDRLAR